MPPRPEDLFYEDLAASLRYWTDAGVAAMTDTKEDLLAYEGREAFQYLQSKLRDEKDRKALAVALRAILTGHAHSMLVSLDGGTKMAESQRLRVTTDDGRPFTDELHQEFVTFLVKNESRA